MRPLSELFTALAALGVFTIGACGNGNGNGNGNGSSAGGASGASGFSGASGGAAGMTSSPGGSNSGGAAATCHGTGQPCVDSTECCNGICNNVGPAPEWIGCQPACKVNADCGSGCCLVFTNADHGFCTDAKWCSCGQTAARCGTTLPKCCDTHACVGGDAQGSFFECRKKCAQPSDCDTGCCVLISSINTSVCLDPSYCSK